MQLLNLQNWLNSNRFQWAKPIIIYLIGQTSELLANEINESAKTKPNPSEICFRVLKTFANDFFSGLSIWVIAGRMS